MFVDSVSPPMTANASISSPNGTATSIAQPSRASAGAPSVRCSCQRVVRISASAGSRAASAGGCGREPEISRPGSTIAVSSVPTACRKPSVRMLASRPTTPRIDASGVMTAISSPAASTIAGRDRRRRSPRRRCPGSASRSRSSSESSPACGSTRADPLAERLARRRLGLPGAACRRGRRRRGTCAARGWGASRARGRRRLARSTGGVASAARRAASRLAGAPRRLVSGCFGRRRGAAGIVSRGGGGRSIRAGASGPCARGPRRRRARPRTTVRRPQAASAPDRAAAPHHQHRP